jgi:hypothetical protein
MLIVVLDHVMAAACGSKRKSLKLMIEFEV